MSPVPLSVDDVLEFIGSLGKFQCRLICFLGYIYMAVVGFNSLSMTFLASEPGWRCRNDSQVCNLTGTYNPGDVGYEHRCDMPREEWEFVDDYTSVITEWHLVCEDSILGSVATSVVFAGTILGSMAFGTLSDIWGRKVCIFLSVMICSTSSLISSFSVNIIMFKICRFFVGVGVGGASLIVIVLAMEFSGIRHRGTAGVLLSLFFSLSLLLQSMLAYFLRDWRMLNIVMSVPGLLSLFFWPLIPESPRWLLVCGKLYEASGVLLTVAGVNNRVMPTGFLKTPPTSISKKSSSGFLTLFKCWKLMKVTLVLFMIWFVVVMVYMSISLSSASLGGNIYLNFFLTGLVEIPSTIVSIWAMNKYGRKRATIIGLVIASLMTALSLVFHTNEDNPDFVAGRVAVVSIAKFAIFMSYNVIGIFTAEVFPTTVRNVGLGACSAVGRLGSFAAPYLLWTARIHISLPYGIMGGLAFISVLLAMTLKETHMVPTAEVLPMSTVSLAREDQPPKRVSVSDINEDAADLQPEDGAFVIPEPAFVLTTLPDNALSAASA